VFNALLDAIDVGLVESFPQISRYFLDPEAPDFISPPFCLRPFRESISLFIPFFCLKNAQRGLAVFIRFVMGMLS